MARREEFYTAINRFFRYLSWMKNKEYIQLLANWATIIGVIAIIAAVYQYSISKQQFEWEFGNTELHVYSYDEGTRVTAAVDKNMTYSYGEPSFTFLICNLKGRPALLLNAYPQIQGPWAYQTEYSFAKKILRQKECEELKANFRPEKPINPEKLDGIYILNLTLRYDDGENLLTDYLVWDVFEIKNRSFIDRWYRR